MSAGVFASEEIEFFMESGCVILRGAFTARQAAAACECVWKRMEEKGRHSQIGSRDVA